MRLAATEGQTFHKYYSCYIQNLHFVMDAEQMDSLLIALASVGVHALSIVAAQNEAERTYMYMYTYPA